MKRLLVVLVAIMGAACSGQNMTAWCVETEAGQTRFISKRVTVKNLGTKDNRRRSYVIGYNKQNGSERVAAIYFDEYATIWRRECLTEEAG